MSAEDDWMTYVDEISGKALTAALVRAERQEELEHADRYGIWDEVPTQACWDQTKAAPISTRWIDTNKGDEGRPNYRSRLVVQEVRTSEVEATFAATPPLESLRFLISLQGCSRVKKKLMFIDIKRAHWCAQVARLIYVKLPPAPARRVLCQVESGDVRDTGGSSMLGSRVYRFLHFVRACAWRRKPGFILQCSQGRAGFNSW